MNRKEKATPEIARERIKIFVIARPREGLPDLIIVDGVVFPNGRVVVCSCHEEVVLHYTTLEACIKANKEKDDLLVFG